MDISHLTYEELLELNKKVVTQIKYLQDVKRFENMMQFSLGEKVSIEIPDHGRQLATILKFNKKTVGIVTEVGEEWNVPPTALRKIKQANTTNTPKANIIDLNDDIGKLQG